MPADPVYVEGSFRFGGPPQPGFCMAGRDLARLSAATEAWHRKLARAADGQALRWPPCGIAGFDRVEGTPGNQRRLVAEELLSSAALRAEGSAMRHCVYTYARRCHGGRAAVYSLKVDHGQGMARRVTVEVDVATRRVAQVRGPCNARPDPGDERVLRAWAVASGLTFGTYALGWGR